jgi:hypothetical protein
MDRRWILAGGGLLLMGIAGAAMVTAEPSKGPVFIAGEQPVIEDQAPKAAVRWLVECAGCSRRQIS